MPIVTKYPQSYITEFSGWTNPENVYAADGNNASALLNTDFQGRTTWYYNFGFSLPVTATINSVEAEVKWYATHTTDETTFSLWRRKGTGSVSTIFSNSDEPLSYTTTKTTLTGTFTASDLNDSTTDGYRIGINGWMENESFMRYRVDYVTLIVDYSENFTKTLSADTGYESTISSTNIYGKVLTANQAFDPALTKAITKTFGATTVGLAGTFFPALQPYAVYPNIAMTEYPISIVTTEYPIEIEVIMMATSGSTIKFTGTFPSAAGSLASLTDVAAKIYDRGRNLLSSLTVTEDSTGVYSAEYTIPETQKGVMTVEFSGVLGDLTIVSRRPFESVWRN